MRSLRGRQFAARENGDSEQAQNAAKEDDDLAEGQRQFRWTLRNDPWNQDPNQNVMQQVSVEVFFTAQNREYSVRMSTLVDGSQK